MIIKFLAVAKVCGFILLMCLIWGAFLIGLEHLTHWFSKWRNGRSR
jgi:H+/Cl- antiporter ClcA